MSNMKQVLLGCVLYANNDKQQAFPPQDTWHEVITKDQFQGSDAPLRNPRLPGVMPGYVYVRPAAGLNQAAPAETVVLYEPAEVEGDAVGVGYLDGHVVMMSKADFDKKVKPKLPAAPPR